jgi:hypothetical protein
MPHSLRQRLSRENPAAAQSGKSVRFGQAAGNYEILSQEKGRLPRRIEAGFQVNLVYQYVRAKTARDFTDDPNC